MADREDSYYVERLIGRVRLLIATTDEMPSELKLETQPVLKELEAALGHEVGSQDPVWIRSRHAFLRRQLEEWPDVDALLQALENFVPCLRD